MAASGLERAATDARMPSGAFRERLPKLNTGPGCLIEEYLFLHALAGLLRPRTILEVGTSFGVGTVCLLDGARSAGDDASITTIDRERQPEFDANLANFPEHADRIERIVEPSGVALERLAAAGRRFDLVFIDAGHDYDDVASDWRLCQPLADAWILHDTSQIEGCRQVAREIDGDGRFETISLGYPQGRQVFQGCVAEGKLYEGIYRQQELPWTRNAIGPGMTLVRRR